MLRLIARDRTISATHATQRVMDHITAEKPA